MKRISLRRLVVSILCLTISLACLAGVFVSARMLPDQFAWRRWQGENQDLAFSQISCFLPGDHKIALKDVYAFRTAMMAAFQEASIETAGTYPFLDCWSTEGSVKVYGERNSGTASVLAVGGDFFAFHPLKLVSGSYFLESDLMQDNILLDEDLAWLLFGGSDLEGMTVHLLDVPFRISGVIARESDYASKKAYTAGMGLYMSYDSFLTISGEEADVGITCYEACIPDPVTGFARQLANNKFPIGTGEILENKGRFSFWTLMQILVDLPARSMRSGPSLPYWENAARYAETTAALLLITALITGLVPAVLLLQMILFGGKQVKDKLAEELLPEWEETAEEAIRVRQRRRWEKKHSR